MFTFCKNNVNEWFRADLPRPSTNWKKRIFDFHAWIKPHVRSPQGVFLALPPVRRVNLSNTTFGLISSFTPSDHRQTFG
jgi:hypothetical protein